MAISNTLTPEFRAGFVALFKPSRPANTTQDPKYSVRALFPPTTNLDALKKAAHQAAVEKWGDKIPKTIRSPFRRNDELENPVPGIGDDWIVMTFSAKEDRRPGLVGPKLEDIIDDSLVYSGCWMRAEVRAYAYDQQGNRGVSFGLQNVQKLRDGEPLGSAKIPASKVFEAVEGAESPAGASSFFD